ncbi:MULTISPECIES: mandelate racemase/muconate lactonizing enzyme family protein [Halolamina]|uniref:L-alanine-DL-glutamate epimerase n=1 Tax=Halolamina pelagica TaxID=699431 RepID=A0A1I5WGS4_9EURY|nr:MULTISPECIES: dipeptide epimerase [Halolamina]NHX37967.1 dipeptide epimerase [Halolamina sp. R1-12]SFQ18829.1 L-alanine-DL-glutamate epimerase [Halolamina pelagica]
MSATITNVETIPVSVPTEESYETSLSVATGGQGAHDHVLVRVETDAGVTGVGEVAPHSPWPHGLTQSAVVDLIADRITPAIDGKPLHRIPRLVENVEQVLSGESFPLCGIDMALHDALGKLRDQPVYELLGGPAGKEPMVDLHSSIGIRPPEEVREIAARAAEEGFNAFKLKVGGPDLAAERAAVEAIAEAVPDARIRIDANQGWTAAEAVNAVPELDEAAGGLVLVEQPVPYDDTAGLRRVREAAGVPVLADEACFSPQDVASLAKQGACDLINIKLAKTGGLSRAQDVATVANAHGLACFMGSMLELGVGTAANAQFAAASPAVSYPSGVLNVHAASTLIEETERWTPDGDRFIVPDSPGLGVTLDSDAVERYRVD